LGAAVGGTWVVVRHMGGSIRLASSALLSVTLLQVVAEEESGLTKPAKFGEICRNAAGSVRTEFVNQSGYCSRIIIF
jgi:hypothetical protein